MGAFDGWFGRRSDNPLQDLDPKVREFLKKESPIKIDSKKPAEGQQSEDSKSAATTQAQQAASEKSQNGVPEQSQFKDGRYSHLWKNYRPLTEIESETKSDHEKLSDILDAFKSRQSAIGAAALENCAEEQFDWNNCMKSGSLRARMTMCRDEVRKFEQCYNMQTKLLKVLGYLNATDKTPEMDERIQMHADKLYHQWVEQDAAAAKAKEEGKPVPKFEPAIPKEMAQDIATATKEEIELSESAKERLQGRLDKVDEREREMEKAAVEAEMRSKKEMIGRVQGVWKETEVQRDERLKKGEATMWDRVATAFRVSGSDKKS